MAANSNPPGANNPPKKPWEQPGTSSGPGPFKPPTAGSTSAVVEASGTAKPGEIVIAANRDATANINSFGRPQPPRPWEQNNYGNNYRGYGYGNGNGNGNGMNYNSGYGYGGYGGGYGGYGGGYGSGLYGNNMYRGGYGGGLYGGSGMFGGGMYNGGYGGYGGPLGNNDPNNPNGGGSPSPPSSWLSFLRVMGSVVCWFGQITTLIDENTRAFHFFMTALLELFDRSGMLYGELARFALRLLGVRTKPRMVEQRGRAGLPSPQNPNGGQLAIEGPKAAGASSAGWDNVWGDSK